MKAIIKFFHGLGAIVFGMILVSCLGFFFITTPEERAELHKAKEPRSPQQELVLRHRTEIDADLKKPIGFEVKKSSVYFEGSSIISCMEFKANEKDWHSVLVKRRSRYVYKTTENAWKKHCADRETANFTSFLEDNIEKT